MSLSADETFELASYNCDGGPDVATVTEVPPTRRERNHALKRLTHATGHGLWTAFCVWGYMSAASYGQARPSDMPEVMRPRNRS